MPAPPDNVRVSVKHRRNHSQHNAKLGMVVRFPGGDLLQQRGDAQDQCEERDQRGDRLYVFNPYSQNYFWIDKKAVDSAERPDIRPHTSKPDGQNCADAIFDE